MSEKSLVFAQLEAKFAHDPEAIAERALLVAAEAICRAMEEQGLTRIELSRRLGVSRQYVTRFLNAPANTTLETIARFAGAVGLEPQLTLTPQRPAETRAAKNRASSRQPQSPGRPARRTAAA